MSTCVALYFFFERRSDNGFAFFFSSRRRHTRYASDWSSDVCSSDLAETLRQPLPPDVQHSGDGVRRTRPEVVPNLFDCRALAGGDDRVRGLIDLLLGDATRHWDVSEFGVHCTRQSLAERLRRELQRQAARRAAQPRMVRTRTEA